MFGITLPSYEGWILQHLLATHIFYFIFIFIIIMYLLYILYLNMRLVWVLIFWF